MKNKLIMKDDIMFKYFFSNYTNYLQSFLEAILGEKIPIDKVVHDARLDQLAKETKYGVLDLDIKLKTGEIINVEMQLVNNKNIEKRTTFYASKKIVEQLEPRGDYKDLNRVIIISILDYYLTDLPEYVTETVRVASKHREYELNNSVKYYYIELAKFRKANPDMSKAINHWLAFIDMERGDLLEMAKKENEEIKDAFNEYEVLIGDEKIKRLAELRLMSELEEKAALATAREKGEKIGREQGEKIGREQGEKIGREQERALVLKENAKKMLKLNISIEQIIEITGLTKEEIENIATMHN